MSVNGLPYYQTDYTYSNVSSTNASFVNLTVTTFNPINADITNLNVSTANISTANISVKNCSTINTSTLNASNTNVNSGVAIQYTIDDIIIPSNGAFPDASIRKLGQMMRINAGTGDSIGFLTGSDVNMYYDGDLNISTNLNLINSSGIKSSISRLGNTLNIIGDVDDMGIPTDINFFTNDGTGTPRLSIKKDTDEIICPNINVIDTMESANVLTGTINTSTANISYVNISDATISNANISNVSVDEEINISNGKMWESTGAFHLETTKDYKISTGIGEVSYFRSLGSGIGIFETDLINVSDINTGHLKLIEPISGYTTFEVNTSGHIYSRDLGGAETMNLDNSTGDLVITGEINSSTASCWSSNMSISNCSTLYISGIYGYSNHRNISGADHSITEYFDINGAGLDHPDKNIIYPAFIKSSGTWDDYNILNMMAFNNDSDSANRYINIPVEMNISILNVSSSNHELLDATEINVSSLNASNLSFTASDIGTVNASTVNASTINVSNDVIINGTNVLTEIGTKQDTLTTSSDIIGGSLNIGVDTDITATIGRLAVGYSIFPDGGGFAHVDRNTATGYALIQAPSGETYINAETGQKIRFSNGNVERMAVLGSGDVAINSGVNGDTLINKCRVGSFGYPDVAAFGHRNFSALGEYGIIHNSVGALELNAVSNQRINFRVGNGIKMTLNGNQGYFGIATLSPSYPLTVNTTGAVAQGAISYISYPSSSVIVNANGGAATSIWSQGAIFSGGVIMAASDQRIKTNIQDISDTYALDKIRLLKPKTYDYIDPIAKGDKNVVGFIAQDIRDDLPEAHQYVTEVIPNVFEKGTIDGNILTLSTKNTDVIELDDAGSPITKLIIYDNENVKHEVNIISIIDYNKLEIEAEIEGLVFVYGQIVDNFNSITKSHIFTINVCATQEIDRQQQADKVRISTLETQIMTLESQLTSVLSRLDSLENP